VRVISRDPELVGTSMGGARVTLRYAETGERIGEIELDYAGETSRFEGKVPVSDPGVYEVIVHAHDPETGNTGVNRTTFVAR
jgi:hypothetical protein